MRSGSNLRVVMGLQHSFYPRPRGVEKAYVAAKLQLDRRLSYSWSRGQYRASRFTIAYQRTI